MNVKASAAHSQAGLALVEFAMILPLLMMLLIGLVELGRLAYFAVEIGNAAHAGAQYGSQSASNAVNTTGISNAAKADGINSISALDVSSSVVCSCWTGSVTTSTPTAAACGQACASGRAVTYVQVTVSGTISPLFNYSALGLPSSWNVSRTATTYVIPK